MINYRLHRFKKLITQIFILFSVLCLLFSLTGCGPQWKKKFVRKRAEKRPEEAFVYEQKEYTRGPGADLYKRHFIFWKAWQEELITRLGENKTADLRSFEEAIKNLDEMKECLVAEKAAELDSYENKLKSLYGTYKSKDFSIPQAKGMEDDLNRLMLKIDKIFRYKRVQGFIK